MKYRITSEDGVVYNGKTLPKGTEIEIDKGPHSDAWLRFKQAEEVDGTDQPSTPAKSGKGGKGGKGKGAANEGEESGNDQT